VTRLEKLRQAVRARLDSGEATITDLAQVQARLADARARLARARADLAIARAQLAAATGRHRPCPPTP
jgi:outer membrane protein